MVAEEFLWLMFARVALSWHPFQIPGTASSLVLPPVASVSFLAQRAVAQSAELNVPQNNFTKWFHER